MIRKFQTKKENIKPLRLIREANITYYSRKCASMRAICPLRPALCKPVSRKLYNQSSINQSIPDQKIIKQVQKVLPPALKSRKNSLTGPVSKDGERTVIQNKTLKTIAAKEQPVELVVERNLFKYGNQVQHKDPKNEEGFKIKISTILSSSSLEDYKIGRVLGKGAFAEVRECMHLPSGKMYATKIYERSKLIDLHKRRNALREIRVLELIEHPNIVHLYNVMETTKSVLLIMELVDGMSLKEHMKTKTYGFSEKEYLKIFKQLLSAVSMLVNRDLKLENVLLEKNENIKIIDFGFSMVSGHDGSLKNYCGTPSYMCPEIMERKSYLGPSADMWALGVILYYIATGNLPFKSSVSKELKRQIGSAEYYTPSTISKDVCDVLKGLLNLDPTKRLDAFDTLQFDIIKNA